MVCIVSSCFMCVGNSGCKAWLTLEGEGIAFENAAALLPNVDQRVAVAAARSAAHCHLRLRGLVLLYSSQSH